MKINCCLTVAMLALASCASASVPVPTNQAGETAIVTATVVQANNHAHPECTASTASRSKVVEPGTYGSMEEWVVGCGEVTRTYKVLIARLGGGVTADVLEKEPILLLPTADECVELRRMLKESESSTQSPTPNLVSAHQQVLFKTLTCK
jgi:hypothetical protein